MSTELDAIIRSQLSYLKRRNKNMSVKSKNNITATESLSNEPINHEQVYYNTLKLADDEELIKRANELYLSVYNKEIEIHMIRNLLINRGLDVSKCLNQSVYEYNRFVKNTPEENTLYGL